MDYEEKYKKAVEKLDKLLNLDSVKESGKVFADVVRGIFPELQESEDERIRKELLSFVKGMLVCHDKPNAERDEKYESWIAWLEKQRKKDEEILVLKDQIESLHSALKATKNVHKIELEKLGFTTRKECDGHNQMVSDPIMSDDDKSEQKPADKAKPKFKVGDFIVNHYCRGRVVELTEDAYLLDTGQGIPFSCEHNVHLWTIQDAKDGDFLCTYECYEPKIVFILKGTPKKHYALSYYCYYNIMYPHFSPDSEKGCLAPNDEDVKPATKEQYDTLMKEMADEGYTFDFEKKELKKIEQKSDKVEPKFKVGDKIQYLKGCGTIMTIEKVENGEYIFANNLGHTTIEDGNKWYLVECNPTWSEVDENAIQVLKDVVKHSNEINENIYTMPLKEKLYDWLKSLKDRAFTKPKLEWSEEDTKMFVNIKACLRNANKDYSREVDWLKSLRPQKQWKPSDEQMHAFEQVYDWYNNNFAPSETLTSLYSDLKKLKGE